MLRSILVLALALGASGAFAQGGLFSLEPGPKIKGHKKLECAECHTEGEGVARSKCLGCHEHKGLRSRILAGKGLHSKRGYSKGCESCHLEHKGSSYNPIDWRPLGGEKRFDHELTGYPLEGAHRRQKCVDCHKSKYSKSKRTKYLGLDANCLSCHEDIHQFQRSHPKLTECTVCHTQDARSISQARGLRFNHKKVSEFALKGRHERTKCANCHTSTKIFKMQDPPKRCVQCHKDPHKNVYTANKRFDCKTCHSDEKLKFKAGKFNHTKLTKFPVRNKHARQKCTKCHEKAQKKAPNLNCKQCHSDDNIHVVSGKDRFKGRDCIQCHNDTGFKAMVFNHKKRTKFVLSGKHDTKCTNCHLKKPKRQIKSARDAFAFFKDESCIGCHSHKNAHEGKFNDQPQLCSKCHNAGRIQDMRNPDHAELSDKFAQMGAHKKLDCAKCHDENLTKLKVGEDCSVCHKDDDAHEGNLGRTCKDCHFEGFPWSDVIFDHNTRAEFPLEGKHIAVACNRCHASAPKHYKPVEKRCVDCHGAQDVHKNALGNDCAKCHDPTGGTPNFNHNTMTDYALEGAHRTADCRGCHYEGDIDPKKQVYDLDYKFEAQGRHCSDCHGDPHGLRRGAQCLGCHDQTDWDNIAGQPKKSGKTAGLSGGDIEDPKTSALGPDAGPKRLKTLGAVARDVFHDVPPFSLRAGHSRLECHRCHQDRGDLQGFGKACDTCHRQEDIHAGSLGPSCGDCHSLRAFTPARWSHTSVGYTLSGAHRVVACKSCHSAGNYMGLSGDCVGCHLDDAARSAFHGRQDTNIFLPCLNCHNQVTWMRSPLFRRRGF